MFVNRNAKLVGYQILYGAGCGVVLQNTVSTPIFCILDAQYYWIFITSILLVMAQYVAIQAEYHHDEAMIPKTSTLVTFTQLVGGAIGLAFVFHFIPPSAFDYVTDARDRCLCRIAGTIFYNCLVIQLHHFAPNLDPSTAEKVRHSVTYIFTLPKDQQVPVIEAYSRAIRYIFILPIPCGIFATLSAM